MEAVLTYPIREFSLLESFEIENLLRSVSTLVW